MKAAIAALAAAGIISFGAAWADRQPRIERFEAAIFRTLKEQHPSLARVEARFLRDGPTITGVAVPKYYLWARLLAKEAELDAVAVRAADDSDGIEILQTVTRDEIRRDPAFLDKIFPAALTPMIVDLASGDARSAP